MELVLVFVFISKFSCKITTDQDLNSEEYM